MAIQSPCLSSGCQVGWNNSIGYFDRTASSCKTKELPIGTDEYNEVWTTFLTSFRAHLTAKGWFDKTVEFCPPLNIQDGTNTAGDFHMIYRTDNTASSKAVTSIRFEMLREGIQDYEKIKIVSAPALDAALKSVDIASGRTAEKTILNTQHILKQISAN